MDVTGCTTLVAKRDVMPLRIRFRGSIGGLSLLRRSLLFAEFSRLAYYDPDTVRQLLAPIGFDRHVEFFDHDGAQAYRFDSQSDVVIACRGTEPNDASDIKADLDAAKVVAETVGYVHRGFKREVDELWPMIEQSLQANQSKKVWFCGHSLGGAMATICAGRCFVSNIPSVPEALFTYGSPRVGNRRYINYCRIQHIRWVNNNDIVPRLPPAWFGFRHAGREMYLNRDGELRRLDFWSKASDRVLGLVRSMLQFRVDWLSDHLINAYIDAIEGVCRRAEAAGHKDDVPLAEFWNRSQHALNGPHFRPVNPASAPPVFGTVPRIDRPHSRSNTADR